MGSDVRVERDKDLKDRYDRFLLYVWNDQDVFVNESLVSTGYAEAVLYQPNDKYWWVISQASDDANEFGSGLWSACKAETVTPEPTAPDDSYPQGPPPGPDLDCSDIDGPVWVGPDDPHRLDRDGDGIGCESN